jgi:YesN/AraC family two-component response regulator
MDNMEATEPTAPITPGKILFVDDDVQFREGLGKRLKRTGFECDFAGTAAAEELLRAKEYDVLLADINMPGNVDLELIKAIPVVSAGLPIILLTGFPTVETATRSVRLRVMAFLTKPPDFAELCLLLDQAINERRNTRLMETSRQKLRSWDLEIAHLQQLLHQPAAADRQATMQSFVRLTLRNLVVSLVELEHLMIHEGQRLGTDPAVEKQELLNAVRKTVSVLQKTKENFKSKELGELRKELETLLG